MTDLKTLREDVAKKISTCYKKRYGKDAGPPAQFMADAAIKTVFDALEKEASPLFIMPSWLAEARRIVEGK